jgi:hypothetical protein
LSFWCFFKRDYHPSSHDFHAQVRPESPALLSPLFAERPMHKVVGSEVLPVLR